MRLDQIRSLNELWAVLNHIIQPAKIESFSQWYISEPSQRKIQGYFQVVFEVRPDFKSKSQHAYWRPGPDCILAFHIVVGFLNELISITLTINVGLKIQLLKKEKLLARQCNWQFHLEKIKLLFFFWNFFCDYISKVEKTKQKW